MSLVASKMPSKSPHGTSTGSRDTKQGDVPQADKEEHIQAVIKVLKQLEPDILTVQEVQNAGALETVAKETGLTLHVISDFEYDQELAILAKAQAVSAFQEEFVAAAVDPSRGFVYAAFKRGEDAMLLIYGVHLRSNSGGIAASAPKREEGIRQLVRHAENMTALWEDQRKRVGIVVAGDLNTDPTQEPFDVDETLRILQEAGFRWTGEGMPREKVTTWISNGRYPDAAFDQIWVKGVEAGDAVVDQGVDREVSDHRAVSVVLISP